MPLVFKQPLILILLILIPAVILWSRKHAFPGLTSSRKIISITLRCIILALLVFSLAGLSIKKSVDEISTIFAIDLSDSITSRGKEQALNFVKDALASMGKKNTAGIVVFGADALVECYPSKNPELGYISSMPKTGLTNIAGALNLGSAMLPLDSRKHLVLLSDGNESLGDTNEAIKLLKLNNIRLSVVTLPSLNKNEVIMMSLKTPSVVRVGERFYATVKVESDVETEGNLQLFQDDEPVKSTVVRIEKGVNEYSFELEAKNNGFRKLKAQVEPRIDYWAENNEAHSITLVEGPPKIMVVEGADGESVNLIRALKSSSLNTTLIKPEDVPSKAASLAEYQAVVLVNVSAEQLGEEKMKAIKSYVRDTGGGLIAIAGDQSFGIGGYIGTPLDDALPVKSEIESRRHLPSVAVVLVVDKSGSMGQCHCSGDNRDTARSFEGGVSKIELAKIAAVGASKVLGKKDYFGVIAVDDRASWVVPLKKYDNKNRIPDMVGSLTASGSQVLEAGVEEAARQLKKNNAQIKHVILLTDGWTGMQGLDPIVRDMKRSGITFSAVAAGGGSSEFLKELAGVGGGRHYPMTTDWDIPKFITKETALISRPYVNQRVFYPKLVNPTQILKSIGDSGIPALKGYIATTPKGRSEITFVSDEGDPILSTWQYGLGTSVAWLSDSKNRWSSNWLSWERFDEFWSSVVRSCMPQKRSDDLIASTRQVGKDVVVSVSFKSDSAKAKSGAAITGKVARPDNSTDSIRLEETSPGKFEGRFEAAQKGTYLVTVSIKNRDGTTSNYTLGHVVSYSSEYRFREPNKALLTRLVSATGGRFLKSPDEAFAEDLPPYYSLREISNYLLLVVFLLFFFDIALRRITISKEDIKAAQAYVSSRWKALVSLPKVATSKPEKEEVISRLEEAKKRASRRWGKPGS